jgi:AraC-like DNA-binding protein
MPIIDAALRGGAVTLLVLLGTLLLRDERRSAGARYGALFALSVAAYVIGSAPGFADAPLFVRMPVQLVSFGTPVAFWILAATLFDDEFTPAWRHGAIWLGMVGLSSMCIYGGLPLASLAVNLLSLLFGGLGIWLALAGRAADLVEARRRLRLTFVVSAALYIVVITVSEMLAHASLVSTPFSAVNASGLLALTFIFTLAQLTAAGEGPFVSQSAPAAVVGGAPDFAPTGEARLLPLDGQEAALLAALSRLMQHDKIYREEGVSIATLAGRLDLPEYRLRRLINQRLGQRNFTAFLNGYRLADCTAALADPGQAEVPILTIALDAGFQSIGPFNRAFKAHTGVTPTEFRRQRLGQALKFAAE